MTPADYLADARRTINPALSPRDRLWESAVGMATEAAELLGAETDHKRVKELGDVCWYIASFCDVTGTDFGVIWKAPPLMPFSVTVSARDVVVTAGMLADHIKKHLTQGHDLSQSPYLLALISAVKGEAWRLNRDIGQIFAANVAKRARRYPDGFTSAASVGRKEI